MTKHQKVALPGCTTTGRRPRALRTGQRQQAPSTYSAPPSARNDIRAIVCRKDNGRDYFSPGIEFKFKPSKIMDHVQYGQKFEEKHTINVSEAAEGSSNTAMKEDFDASSDITIKGNPDTRRPREASVKWEEARSMGINDPIYFAIVTYEHFRKKGMRLADLGDVDENLYKAFTNRCYYLSKSPRKVFEISESAFSKGDRAKARGLIDGNLVKCPKKSEVGKSITPDEYKYQRRAYELQMQLIRKKARLLHLQL